MIKTQKQALKRAVQMFGKNAAVQWNKAALTKTEKAPYEAEREILISYSHQKSIRRANDGRIGQIGGLVRSYKATVGRIMLGMFFEVHGEGDTWEEAFANAQAKIDADKKRYAELKAVPA